MDLPKELRLHVFEEILVEPASPFRLGEDHWHYSLGRPRLREALVLLQVSRQMRKEAGAVWYGRNHFQVEIRTYSCDVSVWSEFMHWAHSIGSDMWTHLRKVTLQIDLPRNKEIDEKTCIFVSYNHADGLKSAIDTQWMDRYDAAWTLQAKDIRDDGERWMYEDIQRAAEVYTEEVEHRRGARGWAGEGIIEVFSDCERLDRIVYNPDYYGVVDDVDDN